MQVGLDQLLLGFGIAERDAVCEVHLLQGGEPSGSADLREEEFEVLAAPSRTECDRPPGLSAFLGLVAGTAKHPDDGGANLSRIDA